MSKPLIDMTEAELKEGVRNAQHTQLYTNDYLNELYRRATLRTQHLTIGVGIMALLVAVASVIVAAIK